MASHHQLLYHIVFSTKERRPFCKIPSFEKGPSLMTYDPINDRKRGELLAVEQVPAEPGSSGMRSPDPVYRYFAVNPEAA